MITSSPKKTSSTHILTRDTSAGNDNGIRINFNYYIDRLDIPTEYFLDEDDLNDFYDGELTSKQAGIFIAYMLDRIHAPGNFTLYNVLDAKNNRAYYYEHSVGSVHESFLDELVSPEVIVHDTAAAMNLTLNP